MLDDGEQALDLGGLADLKHPIGSSLGQFCSNGGHDLAHGRGLLCGAKHHQPFSGGIGVQGGGFGAAPLVLLGVDLVDHGQEVGGAAALRLDGVQLTLGLVGARIEGRNDRLDLLHERVRGQHDEAVAVGLRGDAHQVGHRSAGVLGHEDAGGDRGEGVGLADDLYHL